MAITLDHGRQYELTATCDFTFADLSDNAYPTGGMVKLPAGAIVTGGAVYVTTLFNSGTDDKFSIGHKDGSAAAVLDYYAVLSADITATGLAATIAPTGKKYAEPSTVSAVWNPSGTAADAGVGKLVVRYIIDGRAQENQP